MTTKKQKSFSSESVISTSDQKQSAPIIPIKPRDIAVVHGRDSEVNTVVFEVHS